MKLIFRLMVLGLASLLIGISLGYLQSKRTLGEGSVILSQFLALQEFEVLTSLEYKEADPRTATTALLDLLKFMEEMEARPDLYSSVRKGIELDRGVTYLRLAKLEDANGNKIGSQHDMDQARLILRGIGTSDVSTDHLLQVGSEFDSTTHYFLPYVITFRAKMP